MTRLLPVTLAIALLALSSTIYAGQIWTDGDGDGLPDSSPSFAADAGDTVVFDLWIDAQSFDWTNFLVYVEWPAGCFEYINWIPAIVGGSNFPIDDFSHPNGVGHGGSGFNQGGIDRMATVLLRKLTSGFCCVTPIIDIYNPYYVFSQLGAGSAYMLFSTNPGTCYGSGPPPPEPEACCFPNGNCQTRTPDNCSAAGGVPQGAGTECSSVDCPSPPTPPTGACCLSNGTCQTRTDSSCVSVGGIYLGDDVPCLPNPCEQPPPTVACCFPDGDCSDIVSSECVAQGGTPRGPGSECGETECPQPVGACCGMGPPGRCVEVSEGQCAAGGGVYLGDGTKCEPFLCNPNSLESKSWGRIKGLFR